MEHTKSSKSIEEASASACFNVALLFRSFNRVLGAEHAAGAKRILLDPHRIAKPVISDHVITIQGDSMIDTAALCKKR